MYVVQLPTPYTDSKEGKKEMRNMEINAHLILSIINRNPTLPCTTTQI